MKKMLLFIMAVVCCINYACVQTKFKTVQGKKAPYSISIPVDYFPTPENYPIRSENTNNDLDYMGANGESIRTGVVNISLDDTTNSLKQFAAISDSEYLEMLDPGRKNSIRILNRKMIDINGITAYFFYCHSNRNYYQTLYQFNDNKLLILSCTYGYKKDDSLMSYFNGIIKSVVWDKA